MLLQNFIKNMCEGALGSQGYSTTNGKNTDKVTSLNNTIAFNAYSNSGASSNAMTYAGIALGTDNTPPVYTNTQIKAPITSGLVDVSHQNSNSETTKTLTQTVRNDSADTITVKEIGIFGAGSGNVDNSYYRVLYTRSIINVPILPGETKTFTISINYNKFSDAYSIS